MNARTATIGEPSPTTATMKPSVAARLYAGAVEATPMTVAETSPRAPVLRPLSTCCSIAPGGAPSAVAMTHLLSICAGYATIYELKRSLDESFRRRKCLKPPEPEGTPGSCAPPSRRASRPSAPAHRQTQPEGNRVPAPDLGWRVTG